MASMSNTLRNLVFLATFSVGCATAGGGDGGTSPTPVTTFEHCSSDALRKASEGILGEVTTALVSGDYEAEVTKLAVKYTSAEVGCAVDLVVDLFTKKASRTDDTQTQVVLLHAKAFREMHP